MRKHPPRPIHVVAVMSTLLVLGGCAAGRAAQVETPGATASVRSVEGSTTVLEPLEAEQVSSDDPVYGAAVEAALARAIGDQQTPYALRSDSIDELVLVTWGSSTCPEVPRSGRWLEADPPYTARFLVEFSSSTFQDTSPDEAFVHACTDDLSPGVFRVAVGDVPAGLLRVEFQEVRRVGGVDVPG
ncbi:hypothetical protein GJV82_05550 [Cellulosimicrobium sp. BIT-GX5]|uniref:Lipoprotein n=1 Tax=Cellulosimicrobium composti TaxID=2672572 RepID=A0A6N7ZG28_9MICO|nr:hypothetical protein [Cellulosimicrobium composti]MTG88414.1 hypothetical protein [Cellulosimicrobium composti]